MLEVYPIDPMFCRRFLVGEGTSESGPRLGGRPPEGVVPDRINELTEYFATFPLPGGGTEEYSIFLSFDNSWMLSEAGRLTADPKIQVVCHGASRRAVESDMCSHLSEHPIRILPVGEDWMTDDGARIVESSCKLGGRPFFIHNEPETESEVLRILNGGYRQVLQFDFPVGGGHAVVSGTWPFADGMFHVFSPALLEQSEWLYFWEF